MTAQDQTPAVSFPRGYADALAARAKVLADEGQWHVWLFPCPGCGQILIGSAWDALTYCVNCSGWAGSASSVLGERTPDQIMADIAELTMEWAENG